MKNILILDIHNICFAAQYGVPNLTLEPFGDITSIYTGLKCVTRLSREFSRKWHHVYVCFDSLEASLRKDIYPMYKNRETTPEKIEFKKVFRQQMKYLYTVMQSMGFTVILEDGLEADDIMAHICLKYPDYNKVLVSNDQDLYQLLEDDNLLIYKKIGKKFGYYSKTDFIKEHNIQPKDWISVKAIAGCTSDTIVGIKNIGEVRAISYLNNTLPYKYKKIIEENEEIVTRNLPLVTLPFKNIPIHIPEEEFVFNMDKFKQVCEIFKIKSFSSLDWREAWEKM